MAADKLKCTFHLTENGWVEGSRYYFNKIQGEQVSRPENCLASYELYIHQSSLASKEERTWTNTWKKDGLSESELEMLLKKFKRPTEDSF